MKLNINDEQGLELLHFIFERELKPPFRKGKKDNTDRYPYYNRDDVKIGMLDSYMHFDVDLIIYQNIKYKVRYAFESSYNTSEWWQATKPHLNSWMETQLNVKLEDIF